MYKDGYVFMIRKFVFNYYKGELYLRADRVWQNYDSYPTYNEAVIAAEEIVDEYYAMCEPSVQLHEARH